MNYRRYLSWLDSAEKMSTNVYSWVIVKKECMYMVPRHNFKKIENDFAEGTFKWTDLNGILTPCLSFGYCEYLYRTRVGTHFSCDSLECKVFVI